MKKRFLVGCVALLAATLISIPAASAAGRSCSVVWGSLAKSSTASGGGQPVSVRAGRHRCYDRFVVDLNGAASGYRVEYVNELSQIGSGDKVPVTGGAIIELTAMAGADDGAGKPIIDIAAVDGANVAGYKTFRDVAWAGSFEGQTTIGLGVRARLPFRAFTLSGPGNGSRLVIDVAHRW